MIGEQIEQTSATRRRRRRRRVRLLRRTPAFRVLGGLVVFLLLLGVVTLWYVRSVEADYRETKASVDAVRALIPADGSGERLQPSQLPALTDRLAETEARMRHLDDRVHVPLVTAFARRVPILGERVQASEDFLAFGIDTVRLAYDCARLAREIYDAYLATGLTGSADPHAQTWLSVVRERRSDIDSLLARFDRLLIDRQRLDEEHAPAGARRILADLDPMLESVARARDEYVGLLDYYPVVEEALGAERDGRYLLMLLNSQEIRPSGGFPGTYAIITIRNGRLAEYEFRTIHEFDAAYVARRTEVLPAPGPIRRYLKQEEWLPHDAGWSADFPTSARFILTMNTIAGEAPLEGVAAVTDRAVQQIIAAVGPLEVMIDEQRVVVTGENVIDIIESYRQGADEQHKEAVKIIGTALLERIKVGGFDLQKAALQAVQDAADRREIQLYAASLELQAEIVSRGWDGSLNPDPLVPSFALTLANIVGNKASHAIQAASTLDIGQPAADSGTRRLTWTIVLEHTGDREGHQFYNGFHRTWLAVYLPDGVQLISSSRERGPASIDDDPDAIGYHVPLLPGKEKRITIVVELPGGMDTIRLRRQPGSNDLAVAISGTSEGCARETSFSLSRDYMIDLGTCEAAPAS